MPYDTMPSARRPYRPPHPGQNKSSNSAENPAVYRRSHHMPQRRKDLKTGEPELSYRENRLADEYVANGGNGAQAAIDAGYSPNYAAQTASNVLKRPAVQKRIRDLIAQARIQHDEIIGSLVSQLRTDVTECLDEDGQFNIDLARQNGLGHLLKVSTTIRGKPEPDGSVRTTKIELLPPQAAAVQLSRIVREPKPPTPVRAIHAEKLISIERVIDRIQRIYPGATRAQVIETMRRLQPHLAPYLDELPGSDDSDQLPESEHSEDEQPDT